MGMMVGTLRPIVVVVVVKLGWCRRLHGVQRHLNFNVK